MCGSFRLIEPTEGRVLYDGIDIREYNRADYYKIFGAMFQDYSILPVKIAEIVGEDIYENVDINKVEDCLKISGLWDKINSLSKGLEVERCTIFGGSFRPALILVNASLYHFFERLPLT